jgi:hypothetical protein
MKPSDSRSRVIGTSAAISRVNTALVAAAIPRLACWYRISLYEFRDCVGWDTYRPSTLHERQAAAEKPGANRAFFQSEPLCSFANRQHSV